MADEMQKAGQYQCIKPDESEKIDYYRRCKDIPRVYRLLNNFTDCLGLLPFLTMSYLIFRNENFSNSDVAIAGGMLGLYVASVLFRRSENGKMISELERRAANSLKK